MKKLLVPIDGSESSLNALEKAKELGRICNAEIVVLHVIPGVLTTTTAYLGEEADVFNNAMAEEGNRIADRVLAQAEALMADYPFPVSYEKRPGDAAFQTVKYADTHDVDTIVMGSRGLSALSRTFLGSVSHKVINTASVSVYIIK